MIGMLPIAGGMRGNPGALGSGSAGTARTQAEEEGEMRFFARKNQTHAGPESTISVADLRQRLDRGEGAIALDVRQPHAYAEYPGVIPGSIRIPPADLPERFDELPRNMPIVPYCT